MDNVDGTLTPACDAISGALFPIGVTTVTCTATDAAGNTGSDSFTITVTLVDTTAPVVTAPADVSVTTGNLGEMAVSFPAATAVDNVDPTVTVS